jgi:hypothetical protein
MIKLRSAQYGPLPVEVAISAVMVVFFAEPVIESRIGEDNLGA